MRDPGAKNTTITSTQITLLVTACTTNNQFSC